MKEKWYLLQSGMCSPAYNMALDECLLNWHSEGRILPTLRFYQWHTPTLSTGYFQKTTKEIALSYLDNNNIALVRRLTGGRAVLHDNELTYSIVVSEEHPNMPKTVVDAYRVLSKGLLLGFQHLGLDAHFAIPQTEEERNALKTPRSSVCFDAPSFYELVIEGRKIAGSAQTRQKGIILQHGSVPLTIDLDTLYECFVFPNDRVKERMKHSFQTKAVAINELTQNTFTLEEVEHALINGFSTGLDVEFIPYALTEEQESEVLTLAIEKYENQNWTFKY